MGHFQWARDTLGTRVATREISQARRQYSSVFRAAFLALPSQLPPAAAAAAVLLNHRAAKKRQLHVSPPSGASTALRQRENGNYQQEEEEGEEEEGREEIRNTFIAMSPRC